jgi:hypothetical protein
VATPKDAMPVSASLSHPRAERSLRRRLRQRVDAAMPTKKFRLLSVAMAGGLVLAGVTAAAITNTGHLTPARAALAANMASSPPVNLDNCPTLAEGYTGGCINQLQTELNTDNGTSMPVDGIFGPDTTKAVELFQQNHNIVPADGIVGPQTKAALDNPGSNSVGTHTPAVPVGTPTPGTSGGSGAAKYTRTAHSFFGDKACISGYCAPIGQSELWYDSTDPSGLNLSRIQLNWSDYGRPCSTWIDFDAWSTDGTMHYWHSQGATHTGCRIDDGLYALNDGTDHIPSNAQAIVCGTLYEAGNPHPKLLTRTCVDVG